MVQFVHDGLRDALGGEALSWGIAAYFERRDWLEGKRRFGPGGAGRGAVRGRDAR